MSMSAIFILDLKGKALISRNYRGDVAMSVIDHFMQVLLEQEDDKQLTPILQHGAVTYIYIKHKNVYLVAVTKINTNAVLVLSFLYKIVDAFAEYFNELEEESIRDNFVMIYELLDEFMDFGFPQTTDCKILKEYITQEGNQITKDNATKLLSVITGAVSWRPENIKYPINEVFLDVIESVNILINATGTVMRSEIVGVVKIRAYLSGMPELRLGLNDKSVFANPSMKNTASMEAERNKAVDLEDVKFHQCVRLSRFENERAISFIPPDGAFELMSYRLNMNIKPLFWIESAIERFSHSRVEYIIKAKSQFKRSSSAIDVQIIVNVPSDADGAKFTTATGVCRYDREANNIVWKIRTFTGGKEFLLKAHFNLPSVVAEEMEGRPPIQVKFEIPYYTASGLKVRYLKIIEKSGYPALPWVRYVTKNGDYQIRTK